MSSVERTPTSVEVGAVVVETSAQKSAASKEWNQTLSHDAERKARAVKRSETFQEAQRFFHDKHGEGSIVSRSADGIVVMKFDNGEVHKYDLISQRKLRPIIEDAHTYTAETLFDIVDTDSSGVLEKAEFVYMHTMVQNSEKRAGAKIADAKRAEDEQRRAKRVVMWALLAAFVVILAQLGGMVGISFAANEATKESHVREGGVMAALDGEVVKTAESTVALPLYVAPVLPVGERESLSVMTISYRDPSVHDRMVEAGIIAENDTTAEYPTVEETVQVLSFTRYNATAADLAVVPKRVGEHRVIRIFNGEATLVTTRADGTSYYAVLCAGKVSCAAFTVETGIADAFIEQAQGNLTAAGVEVPTGRRLEANTASIHRRLSEEGDCPCADGWVKYKGEWVQPTDEEAAEAGYVKSDEVGACGCITWVKKARRLLGAAPRELGGLPDEGRELFEKKIECEDAADDAVAALTAELDLPHANCAELRTAGECDRAIVEKHCPATCDACDMPCEDAADELVKQLTASALGRALSCGSLKDIVGACNRAIVVKHCPASCGLCEGREYLDRHLALAAEHHRQLKKTCG